MAVLPSYMPTKVGDCGGLSRERHMSERAPESEQAKPDRFLKNVKRTQAIIALAYAYDAAMLFGFSFAGYVEWTIPLIFVALCSLCGAAIAWAHLSGWSRACKNPTLFLPQQFFAISVALIMALLAPQIGFSTDRHAFCYLRLRLHGSRH